MFAHAALLATIALGVQPAGGAALDPPAFIHELERATDAIRRAASVEDVSASIPLRWTVRTETGPIVVDTAWIREEFAATTPESWPSIRRRVANRLENMRHEAAGAHLDIGGDPRAALADTLATTEFERAQASNWLEQMRRRISAWLLRLLDRIFGASVGNRTIAVAFAWIAGTIALIALALWLGRLMTRRSPATALELDQTAHRAPAREWALRALAAARAGDLREAVRCGFHAAVRRLEEQGTWSVDDARTPREYLRLLHGDDPRCSTLGDLTRRFEQVWYGHRSATGDDVRHITGHLERLGCLRPGEQAN